jgi:hypothetical protein
MVRKSTIPIEIMSDGRFAIKLNQSNQLIFQQMSVPAQIPFVNTGININKHLKDEKELTIRANGCVSTGVFPEIIDIIGKKNITDKMLFDMFNEGKSFQNAGVDDNFMFFVLRKFLEIDYNNLNSSPLRGPSGKQYEFTESSKTKDHLSSIQKEHSESLRLSPKSEWGCLVGFFAPTKTLPEQERENAFDLLRDNRKHNYQKIKIFEVNEFVKIKRKEKNLEITDLNGQLTSFVVNDTDMNLFLGINDSLALSPEDLLLPERYDSSESTKADREIRRYIKKHIENTNTKPYYIYYSGNTGHFNVNFTIE